METVPVSSSSPNAEADTTENTPAKKRRRRLYSSEAGWRKIRVPANCSPAIDYLKKELGVRSGGDAILWLIDQVRPELITHGPNPKRNQPCGPNISPVPACMPQQGEEHLQLSFPGGSPATRRPPVRATVVQASTLFFDTAATLDKAERLTAMAAAYGSQLLVFPEAFIGGYPRCVRLEAAALPHKTEAEGEFQKYYDSAINVPGPEVERLAKIAGKYRIHLVMGVVERAELYLFSTVLFFDPQGQHLGQHRKLMLVPPENAVWSSGKKSSVPIFETSIGRIGGLICWDNKLPHLRTELYTKGVEIYCAPTADAREVWKATVTHTALEGGCFVLSANQFCRKRDYPLQNGDSEEDASLDAITSDGGSLIVSPSGTILAGPNYKGECLISADLDLGEITRTKIEFGGVVE